MRRKSPYHILLLPLLLCMMTVASCGSRSVMRELESMESVLDDSPDSVRSRLDRIDASSLHGESRALYAMLRTQADYKCYVDIPGDSLIREATSYYGIRRKNWRAAMSWYSLGCVYTLQKDDTGAIDAYLKALGLFPDTLSHYSLLCGENLGIHYARKGMCREAIASYERTLAKAELARDSALMAFCRYSIGVVNLSVGNMNIADSIFSISMNDEKLSVRLRNECNLGLAKIYLYHYNRPDTSLVLVERYINGRKGKSSAALSVSGDIYYALGNYQTAYRCYNESLECGPTLGTTCNDYRRLSELSVLLGDTVSTVRLIRCYVDALDSLRIIESQDSITSIHIAYYSEVSALHQQELRKRMVLSYIFMVILTILLIVLYYTSKIRKLKAAYIGKCDELRKRELSTEQTQSEDLGDMLRFATGHFRSSNGYQLILCLQETNRTPDYSEIAVISHDVGLYYGRVMEYLQESVSSLNDKEIGYCLYKYLNVNSRLCMELLGRSQSYASTLKRYVRRKLPEDMFKILFRE